jgi:intracellular sulfur oxidation DsrE/DsrF family protein
MINFSETTRRRGFLGTVAAGAVSVLGLASLAKSAARGVTHPSLLQAGTGDASFEEWIGKMKGKHKQVFDAPGTNNGLPFAWARVFLMSNKQFGTPESEITAVIILRHEAIPNAMGHDLWAKYKFGEVFKVTDGATKAPALRNPFFQPKEGELPLPGMAIEDLQKSGVLMGVCDMAMTVYSKGVGKSMNMDPADVKKDWVAGLLPGIQILPSGVYAVNRVQEAGCTYCYAG